MAIEKIMGSETELGITARAASGFDPVGSSIFLINALPDEPRQAMWDYTGENPLFDARGYEPPVDIAKAQRLLDYQPTHTIEQGLADTADWGAKHLERPGKRRRQSSRPKEQMPAVQKPHPVTFAFLPNGAEEVSNPWLASEQPLVPGHA